MTVANTAVPSSSASSASSSSSASPTETRRARLQAATHPVLAGPSTSAVAIGASNAGEVDNVTLANAYLRLDVAPHLGGGLTRFDWRSEGNLVPVFRRCRHVSARTDANELACYSLLPYSNRIGGGRFTVGGRTVDVPCNRAGESLPIHGDGWLASWHVADMSPESVRLTLDRSDGKPYAYRATQSYTLDGPTLVVTLDVENVGRDTLPFGLGVHPFLVRDDDTQLSAAAAGLWLSDDDWLPVRQVPVPPAWQFGVAYPLPRTMVNHAFIDWSGHATVVWPKRRLSLTVSSSTDYYVLYTPPGEDFFCFEPVDHPINAMNLPGGAAEHGMTMLARGERLSRTFRFTVEHVGLRAVAGGRGARRQ